MSVSRIVLKAVGDYLKEQDLDVIPKAIHVLPERIVTPTAGQDTLTISGESLEGLRPNDETRPRRVIFSVSLSRRVKSVPEDRLGDIAYLKLQNQASMSIVMETVTDLIESLAMKTFLDEKNDEVIIPPELAEPGATDLPSLWLTSGTFSFRSLNLDPVHLYHSDFWTRTGGDKEELMDKVAGLRMTAVFGSPRFQRRYNPLSCNYELYSPEESSSSS